MPLSRRSLLAGAALAAAPRPRPRAQQPTIKIGVLNDQSGPYRDISGMNSVGCVRQAVQDFGSKGFQVDVVFADHQNKPELAPRSPVSGSTATAWT